jgi:hypothetical protein
MLDLHMYLERDTIITLLDAHILQENYTSQIKTPAILYSKRSQAQLFIGHFKY